MSKKTKNIKKIKNILNHVNIRYILVALIIIGFLLGVKRAWQKHSYESANRRVELAMSLDEVKVMSDREGINLSDALSILKKDVGITSLSVSENTLSNLAKSGKLSYYPGSDILRNVRGGIKSDIYDGITNDINFAPDNIYIFFGSKSIRNQVLSFYKKTLHSSQIRQINEEIWEIKGDETELTNIGFGFSQQEIKICEKYGFGFLPRIKFDDRFNEKTLKAKFKKIKNINISKTIIFGGKKIPGYPKNINFVAKTFKEFNLNFGFVEFAEQEGDVKLYKSLPNNSLKVHSISPGEMEAYTPKRIRDRLVRAVRERQVKILMIHPVLTYDYNKGLFVENVSHIEELKNILSKNGYNFGQIEKLNFSSAGPMGIIEVLFFVLAIAAAFILLINSMGFQENKWLYTVFSFALFIFILFTVIENYILLRKFTALASALIFPPLAIISFFPKKQRRRKRIVGKLVLSAITYLLSVFAITLVGAVIIAGILSDEYFLSGSHRFIGVKFAFLFPILLIGIYYYMLNKKKFNIKTIKKMLISPLLKGEVGLVLFFIVFLGIYILRSGNYVVLPFSGIEESFRNLLDKLLIVRPRTKEMFIGIPFLFLASLYYPSRIKRAGLWFFQCLGVIGLISLTNTFCHIHSPVYISIIRSINGLIAGLVVGFIYLFFVELYFYVERVKSK